MEVLIQKKIIQCAEKTKHNYKYTFLTKNRLYCTGITQVNGKAGKDEIKFILCQRLQQMTNKTNLTYGNVIYAWNINNVTESSPDFLDC